jgi:hypothetical protein
VDFFFLYSCVGLFEKVNKHRIQLIFWRLKPTTIQQRSTIQQPFNQSFQPSYC